MLQKSKIIYYNVDNGKFEVMDKLLTTVEYQFDLTTETILDWTYDMKRRMLWVLTQTALYRVRLDFNSGTGAVDSHTLEATITVTINTTASIGKRLDIHWKTGDCFYMYHGYNPCVMTIFKILVNGSTATSLSITNELNVSATSPPSVFTCVDQSSGKIVIITCNTYNGATADTVYRERWGVLVANDLSAYYDILPFASLWGGPSISINPPVNSYNAGYYLYSRQEIYYDVSNGLIKCNAAGNYDACVLFKVIGNKVFVEFETITASWLMTNGYKTGNKYIWIDSQLKCYDKNGVELYAIVTPFSNWGLIFNHYTEEFYRVNNTTKVLYAYDRWARQVGVRTAFTTVPSFYLPLPGGENAVSIGISPNIVVAPNANQRTSDTTPTVVFKAGISPAGWTQQFTTVMDRTFSIVDGGTVSGTYERIASSWANSANYKDWTWQYSTDYSETLASGTWSALGTGDPLQTGGSMPTNGIISDSDQSVYVRFTVANDDALTGASTEDIWYMKVFSHSA